MEVACHAVKLVRVSLEEAYLTRVGAGQQVLHGRIVVQICDLSILHHKSPK